MLIPYVSWWWLWVNTCQHLVPLVNLVKIAGKWIVYPQKNSIVVGIDPSPTDTQCHRRSPNVAVKCHSRMELRPPTARKSHPNFFAHCKRSTKMKKYKKTIIPNVQNTIRTQVTPMVLNYGKLSKKRYMLIAKHHVNAWFMYVWVEYLFWYKTHLIRMLKV